MDTSNRLHWLDYLIFIAILSTTIIIGLYFAFTGKRQRTIAEYFTGNRKLSLIPTILSYIVSYRSAVSIVGLPVESYFYGGQFLIAVLALMGVVFSLTFVVPVIYPLQLLSINGYLELRWKSKWVKLTCSALVVIRSILYLGIATYSSSVVIAVVAKWHLTTIILVTSGVGIVFTMIGGLKAVIWTDVILCVCMFSGVFMILGIAIVKTGGFADTWNLARDGGRLNIFDFRFDPTLRYPFWTVIIGQSIDLFCWHSFLQPSVQRYSNVKTLTKAKQTMLFSALGEFLFFALCLIVGIVLYAYYASIQCDPLKQGAIASPNLLVPHFVLENLNFPGALGFFSASVIAATVSTLSSYLNSSAAILWDDFGRNLFLEVSTQRATTISKCIVLILGILTTGFSIIVQYLGGTILQMFRSLGVVMIPVFGIFIAGLFCPWFNKKGLLVGSMCGFGVVMWICCGQFYADTFTRTMLSTSSDRCIADKNSSVRTLDFQTEYQETTGYISDNARMDPNYSAYTTAGSTNDINTDNENESGFSQMLVRIYSISFLWYTTIGLTVFLLTGSAVSVCTGREKMENIDERLLVSWYRDTARGNLGMNKGSPEKPEACGLIKLEERTIL